MFEGQGNVALTFVTCIHEKSEYKNLKVHSITFYYIWCSSRTMIKENFQEEKNFQSDYPLIDLNLKKNENNWQ